MTKLRRPWWMHWTVALCLSLGACAPKSTSDVDDSDDSVDGDDDVTDRPSKTRDAGKGSDAKGDASGGNTRDAGSTGDDEGDDEGDDQGDDDGDDESAPDASTPRDAGGSSSRDGGMTTEPSDSMSLLPFKEGNTWTYRVSGGTGTAMKVTTVGPMEKVGGTGPNKDKMAFKVTTMKGSDRTVSWQAVEGDSVIRYREISYSASTGQPELEEHWSPSKLHIHSDAEHTKAGAKWTETYQETKIMMGGAPMTKASSDSWSVDSPKVSVTVAAGKFDSVVFVKASPSGNKTYWYVPGVGKVKETGGQTEELVSYKLVP